VVRAIVWMLLCWLDVFLHFCISVFLYFCISVFLYFCISVFLWQSFSGVDGPKAMLISPFLVEAKPR
jgi:hypothetical protein